MKTSNFAKSSNDPNAVAITAYCPFWFNGKHYLPLAPPYKIVFNYKKGGKESEYREDYYRLVLAKLDPQKVFDDLGPDATLLCFEKAGKFCHRRIVAEWLEKELGIKVEEK